MQFPVPMGGGRRAYPFPQDVPVISIGTVKTTMEKIVNRVISGIPYAKRYFVDLFGRAFVNLDDPVEFRHFGPGSTASSASTAD